jgi:hypothetical protein
VVLITRRTADSLQVAQSISHPSHTFSNSKIFFSTKYFRGMEWCSLKPTCKNWDGKNWTAVCLIDNAGDFWGLFVSSSDQQHTEIFQPK